MKKKSSEIVFLEHWVGKTFEVPEDFEPSMENLIHFLEKRITEYIESDLEGLYQLLYRIDIDEEKLKKNLKEAKLVDSARLIAEMIIERQLEKAKTRKDFS